MNIGSGITKKQHLVSYLIKVTIKDFQIDIKAYYGNLALSQVKTFFYKIKKIKENMT
jgi:hypothetical protein